MSRESLPLAGTRVVTIAVNLPGPAAAARLVELGASVTKVEPPTGDPMAIYCHAYYAELAWGQETIVLDLKDPSRRGELDDLLADADLFLTSHRPSALRRLGLAWADVHERHPDLCQIAIVGHPAPDDDRAGHDLTYQAEAGLLGRGHLPSVLAADLAGGERAVSEALAVLLRRARTGEPSYRQVALSTSAQALGAPWRYGLTVPHGLLGGALPAYRMYPTAHGEVAVAALEPHFHERLLRLLAVDGSEEELAAAFATRTALEWQDWAIEHDLPVVVVR